jgi:hypothetical protein
MVGLDSVRRVGREGADAVLTGKYDHYGEYGYCDSRYGPGGSKTVRRGLPADTGPRPENESRRGTPPY